MSEGYLLVIFDADACGIFFPANSERPVQDYAKSGLEVAEYQMRITNGDLLLARDYLEKVAGSNAEDVGRASELLKLVNVRVQTQAREDAEARAQKMKDPDGSAIEPIMVEMAPE